MPRRRPADIARDEPRLVRFERAINKAQVQDFLKSSYLKVADARRAANSGPTRLEAAYDAILMCGHAVFAAQQFRITSHAGHHDAALEGLAAELGLSQAYIDEIASLQSIRNTKYTGLVSVNAEDLKVAVAHAERVLNETEAWFQKRHPELLKP